MKRTLLLCWLMVLVLFSFGGAQTDTATTDAVTGVSSTPMLSAEQERTVQRIGMKIHCPICSGESIAQSQTDISREMMNEVRTLVGQGKSEGFILAQFVAGYGERILLEPPKRGITSLLWTLPLAFLVLGIMLWVAYLRRMSRPVERTLSADEERRIADLLAERK